MPEEQILLIDNNDSDILIVRTALEARHSYRVTTIREDLRGLDEALWKFPHVILLNARLMPAASQVLISTFQETQAQTPIILLYPPGVSEPTLPPALRSRVAGRLSKPIDLDTLADSLRRVFRDRLSTGQFRIIDRAQLHQLNWRLQRKLDESREMFKISRAVASLHDLETLLIRIVEAAVYITRAEEGSLLLLDAVSGELYMRAQRGLGEVYATGFKLKVTDSLAGSVVQSGRPLRLADTKQDRRFKFKTGYLVKSLLMVPLRVGDENIGVLGVDNKVSDRVFTGDDEDLLSMLADYAAIAIRNAELLTQSHQQAQNLMAIHETSTLLTATLDSSLIPRLLIQQAVDFLQARSGSLCLVDDERQVVRFQFALDDQGREIDVLRGYRMALGQGIVGQVAETGKPIIANEAQQDPDWYADVDTLLGFHTRSVLAVPLRYENRTIGVVELLNKPDGFSRQDQELLTAIASSAAIAIQNAHSLERSRRRARNLATIIEVGRQFAAGLNPEGVLSLLTDSLTKVVTYAVCRVFVHGEGTAFELKQRHVSHRQKPAAIQQSAERGKFMGSAVLAAYRQRRTINSVEIARQYPAARSLLDEGPFLAVPMMSDVDAMGVILLECQGTASFTHEEQQWVEILAGQAAIALEKTRLFQSVNQRYNELLNLATAAQELELIVENRSLEVVLAQINEKAARLTNSAMCGVLLLDDAQERLAGQVPAFGVPDEIMQLYQIPLTPGTPLEELWRSQDHYLISDARRDPLIESLGLAGAAAQIGLESTLLVSLRAKGKLIGVIQVSNRRDGCPYTGDDVRLLTIFAAQAAAVIENTRLFQRLDQRARELSSLLDIGRALAAPSRSLTEMLQRIVQHARRMVDADMVVVLPYDHETQTFQIHQLIADGVDLPLARRRPRPQGLTAAIMDAPDGPIVILDVEDTEAFPYLAPSAEGAFRAEAGVKSLLGVRLQAGGEPVGVLYIDFCQPHAFSSDEINAVQIFATQAAVAIQNSRLFERTDERLRKRLAGLKSLMEIDRAINAVLDLDEVLRLILQHGLRITGAERGDISLYDPRRDRLVLEIEETGSASGVEKGERSFALGEGIRGWVAQNGRVYRSGDVQGDEHYTGPLDIRSEMAVPLRYQERLVGVLNVESTRRHAFDADDQEQLEAFAGQTVIAIQNAQKVEQLNQVRQVTQSLTSSFELQDVLTQIVTSASAVLRADSSVIWPYDAEQDAFQPDWVVYDGAKETDFHRGMPERGGIAYQILEQGQVFVPDTDAPPEFMHIGDQSFLSRQGVRSFVGTALRAGDETLGVLYVNFGRPHHFSQDELDAIQTFANQAAIAIQKAQRLNRLVEAQRTGTLGFMVQTIAHGLRNPLNNISTSAQILQQTDMPPQQRGKKLAAIMAQVDRAAEMIAAMLAYADMTEGKSLVNVNQLVENALLVTQNALLVQLVETRRRLASALPQVLVNPRDIVDVFVNIIINAAQAMAESEKRLLTITSRENKTMRQLEICFTDTGVGISPSARKALFRRSFSTKGEGHGYGLLLSDRLVRRNRGRIDVASDGPGKGTTFTVVLPLDEPLETWEERQQELAR